MVLAQTCLMSFVRVADPEVCTFCSQTAEPGASSTPSPTTSEAGGLLSSATRRMSQPGRQGPGRCQGTSEPPAGPRACGAPCASARPCAPPCSPGAHTGGFIPECPLLLRAEPGSPGHLPVTPRMPPWSSRRGRGPATSGSLSWRCRRPSRTSGSRWAAP